MKKMSIVLFGLLVCMTVTPFVGTASAKTASSAENSVNAGFAALPGLFDTEATVFFVEYERKLGDKISILGRFGVLDYEFDDGSYTEDGDGPGFDVGVRFYPMAGAMEKLYIGGSLGLWTTDWTYVDSSYFPFTTYYAGSGESTALKIEFEVGYRFPIANSPVAVIPAFRTGSYISVDDSCNSTFSPGFDCGNESEAGAYGVLGVSVGFQF